VFDAGGAFDSDDANYSSVNRLASDNLISSNSIETNPTNNTNNNADKVEISSENSQDSNAIVSVEKSQTVPTHSFHFECNVGYVLDLEPHEIGMNAFAFVFVFHVCLTLQAKDWLRGQPLSVALSLILPRSTGPAS
jgi:hypothetical protein